MPAQVAPFLRAFRFPIYALFAAALAAPVWFVSQAEPVRLALAVAGGFLIALLRLRHFGMALAVALAPLPAILWLGTSAYALTIGFTLMAAAAMGEAMLKEENPLAPLPRLLLALGGVVLFALLWSLHVPVQLPGLLAATAAAAFFLPLLVLTLPLGEAARARGNRQRESLVRASVLILPLAEPRWAVSLSGAGLVQAVLGIFEVAARPPRFDWLAVLAAGVLLWGLTRDIRAGLAALAAAALLLLFTGGVNGALLLFLFFAGVLGQSVSGWRGRGETSVLAWMRALEDHTATILFAGLAAACAAGFRGGAAAALHAGLAVIAALILFPAFAGALHHLFPPRRSVEEFYKSNAS